MPAAPAFANITDITLHGSGVVTVSNPAPDAGVFGPPVGSPVTVNVILHLGTATGDPDLDFAAAPADGYTGHYSVSADELFFQYARFGWSVSGADNATTLDSAFNSGAGEFDFVNGRLTGFSVYYEGDPDGHSLSQSYWDTSGRFSGEVYQFSGTWAIDADPGSPTPEPAAWTLMIAGFAAAGGMARYRRRDVGGWRQPA